MPKLRPFAKPEKRDWPLPPRNKQIDDREALRQWLLRELVEVYGYPREWLGHRIILIEPKNTEFDHSGIFGFCVLTVTEKPFLWASICETGESVEAENALKSTLLKSGHVGVGLSSDGTVEGTRFVRRRFDSTKCDYILDLESYTTGGPSLFSQLLLTKPQSRGPKTTAQTLLPLTEKVENVFFEVHSHIRDIDGLHADEALDEVCKVLYVKMFDEETTADGSTYNLQRWVYGSSEEFAAVVRYLYEDANSYDSRVFGLKIPGYQRSRGVFSSPIRLSGPALVKAVETLQEYTLTGSPTDVKGRAFQKVLGPAVRSGMGQYFTPEPVVALAVKVLNPTVHDLILDPFCGSAHFLTRCLQQVRHGTADPSSKAFHEFAFGKLHGIEKSDRMVRVAMTDMRLHGDGHSNIRCTDALLSMENYQDIQPESFDAILTNPPFGSLLGPEAMGQLGIFALAAYRKTVPLEILGLERCVQFLRPGGRLAIVLPDGILANRGTRYVREWLESQGKVRAIVSLPIEAFSPFGANIKTSVLFFRKWKRGEKKEAGYSVCMCRSDNVGYDASGRSRDEVDLSSIGDHVLEFLAREGW